MINFLVSYPFDSMFVKSVDASSYMKINEKVFYLLDSFVEEIGEMFKWSQTLEATLNGW